MITYDVIVTPAAEWDLQELRDAIAFELHAPQTALDYINSIETVIASLQEMPQRIKPVDDEPWHSYGIRRVPAEKYYVYFRIAEDEQRVYVLNVIFQRRDQLKALRNTNPF